MPAKASTKTKAAPKQSAALPLNKKVNFKSPMVLAVIGLFVALGTFFILRTFAATNPYSCPSPSLPMQQGASGTCVKYLQWTLNTYFYRSNKLSVDGQFGPNTKAAVQGYQYASNTPPVDGVVTSALWSKLVALNTGFNANLKTYNWKSPGIYYTDLGSNNTIPNDSVDVQVNPTTVLKIPVLIQNIPHDSYNPGFSAWLMYGPYAQMTIPSGAHGIQACYRVGITNMNSGKGSPLTIDYQLWTDSGGHRIIANSKVSYPNTSNNGTMAALAGGGNVPITYNKVCIQHAANVGSTYNNLQTSIQASTPQTLAGDQYRVYLVNTELSFY